MIERVVETFIERHAKRATRDWKETERLLNRDVIERWKGRRLSTITKPQVHDLLNSIVDRGAPIAANRVHTNSMSWVERGIVTTNPFAGIKAPSSERSRARERVLSDDELRLVWTAAEAIGWPFGSIVKLLALTGARRDEVAQVEWREIDFDRALWMLPAARSKNRREHAIPLSVSALEILRSLPRVERSGFVFTTTNGRVPVSGFNKAKDRFDNAIGELRAQAGSEEPIEPWVFHDLRRTMATNLQKLGVRLEVTEAVLNHVSGSRAGIVGVYQKHDYATEKRQALEAWAKRVEEIVAGARRRVWSTSRLRGDRPMAIIRGETGAEFFGRVIAEYGKRRHVRDQVLSGADDARKRNLTTLARGLLENYRDEFIKHFDALAKGRPKPCSQR